MAMDLIEKFLSMEVTYGLFDLNKNSNLPFWDCVRQNVYSRYTNTFSESSKYNRRFNVFSVLYEITVSLLMLVRKSKICFFVFSREKDRNGYYYDRVAADLIDRCKTSDRIIIEFNRSVLQKSLYNEYSMVLLSLSRRFFSKENISIDTYRIVSEALVNTFGECKISFEDINLLYNNYYSQYRFYKILFRIIRPKKVIVSCDLQKAIYYAAKINSIPSFEMQHAAIVHDYISYLYPKSISNTSNISFADSYITLGSAWGIGMNIPAKNIIALGNSRFYLKKGDKLKRKSDCTLVISTILHYEILRKVVAKLSSECPDCKIVYKLHPAEFGTYQDYISYFDSYPNVEVVRDEYAIQELLLRSSLTILIYSSVFFEALEFGNKIAVVKEMNYHILRDYLNFPNVYLVDAVTEIKHMMDSEVTFSDCTFFSEFDENLADLILYT